MTSKRGIRRMNLITLPWQERQRIKNAFLSADPRTETPEDMEAYREIIELIDELEKECREAIESEYRERYGTVPDSATRLELVDPATPPKPEGETTTANGITESVSNPSASTAKVILFRQSGKYYTQESWRIPEKALGPWDMIRSPDFRRIADGPVYVETQEPWGYPHLLI
jgi:hypothetical protein